MLRTLVAARLVAAACALAAQAGGTASGAEPPGPLAALPVAPVIDITLIDRSVDPCVDFYRYACGGWIKNNPIPPDQSSWGVSAKLEQDSERFLWGILSEAPAAGQARSPSQQKISDYFTACMDEKRIAALGISPLETLLGRIDGLRGRRALAELLADLHRDTNASAFFDLGPAQDPNESRRVIATFTAGGLSLPERDYYLRHDARSTTLRRQYLAHVARVFELAGSAAPRALREATTVLAIETRLASATLRAEDTRDPYRLVHKVDLAGLARLSPGFDWGAYFERLGVNAHGTFNVTEPRFLREFANLLSSSAPGTIQTYLRWHALHYAAPLLTQEFVQADFEFYAHTLRGVPEIAPRWRRCVNLVDSQLGDALGQEFVARAFAEQTKQRVVGMTQQIERAMQADLEQIGWMSPATRREALAKLHNVINKVGYPDRWRDYEGVVINPTDFFGNVTRATRFESARQLAKIGRPVDRSEWEMTAPTINAYYGDQTNDINFPAGILQPPLFDPGADDAANFGGTGATIGHELTHGFDDQGRKYDADGDLRDWWQKGDSAQYERRAQCIVDQFDHYTVLDGLKVNGKLTAGENIADLGGLVIAWMAWRANGHDVQAGPREGLTPEQRFFVANAQSWCTTQRDEQMRVQVLSDPHAPEEYRVNGPLSNLPEFGQAFACHAGQPMVAARACRVW